MGNHGNKYGTKEITREYNGWSVLRDKGLLWIRQWRYPFGITELLCLWIFRLSMDGKDRNFKNSDVYNRIQEQNKLEEKYWSGEITYEELQEKVAAIYTNR